MLAASADVALRPGEDRSDGHWGELVIGGRATGRLVPGVLLDAQFVDGARRLLFTNQDIPFEERADILLLDGALRLLDRAVIGRAYATGTLRDLRIETGDRLSFAFFGEGRLRLTLLPRPRLRLFGPNPSGVDHPAGRHWFTLAAG